MPRFSGQSFDWMRKLVQAAGLAAVLQLSTVSGASASDAIDRHLIIQTGCWAFSEESYFDPNTMSFTGGPETRLDNILNFVIKNKHSELQQNRFEAYGGPASLDFDTHLIWIYDALKEKNVKSIVYINGPGALQSFTRPEVLPEVAELLKRMAVEYPSAAVYAKQYYNYLIHSEGYRKSPKKPSVLGSVAAVSNPAPAAAPVQATSFYNSLALRVAHLRDTLASRLAGTKSAEERTTLAAIEKAATTYSHPMQCGVPLRPSMLPQTYWIASGGPDVWQTWLRMVGEMGKAAHIPIVFYLPPDIPLSADGRVEAFKSEFLAPLRHVLDDYPEFKLIDESGKIENFNQCDTLMYTRIEDGRRTDMKLGQVFNAIGKIKQSEMMLSDLSDAGIFSTPINNVSRDRWWERHIPKIVRNFRAMPEKERESFEELVVRPSVFKLSEPAEVAEGMR
jgi:hypothetical protein